MKVLIVRFSSIGDIVLTSSVVRAMKQQLNNVEIHYLTKEQFSGIVASNSHISKVVTITKSIDEVLDTLKSEQYDYVIDLHNNVRTVSLKRKLGVPSKTFRKLNVAKWLLVRFKWNRLPKMHVVDRYFEAVQSLGVVNDDLPGEYFIPPEAKVDVQQKLGVAPKSYITIAIGAQFKTKQMPVSLVVEIVRKSTKPVVIVGGEMDKAFAERVINQVTEQKVISACGNFNLNGSASIVAQSAKLITNDTGMMHIAACLSIPIVSVWGNTVPDFGMYPYYPNQPELFSMHEVEGLSCRPCSKIGFQECPKKHFNCMHQQDVEAIVEDMNC